jgi:hypothetical protein
MADHDSENDVEELFLSYTVSLSEHRLIVKGLGYLKLVMLEQAGKAATASKPAKRRGSEGSAILDQVHLLLSLRKRLRALAPSGK